jgi:hypothetical protein
MKKMKIIHAMIALVLLAIMAMPIAGPAAANVPGVALNAPPPPPAPNVATAGSEQTIKVVVTHRDTGAPPLHYVDSVMLYGGSKPLKEWKYGQNDYKTDEVWTETYTGVVESNMRLRAVAHCTVHGYEMADVLLRVLPKGTMPSAMMGTDASSAGMQAFGYSDVKKASEFLSPADSQFLKGIIKSQSGELKSFQGKLSDWVKSSAGQQFISQRDRMMAGSTIKMMLARTGGTVGTSGKKSLVNESRYAGRGPGIVDGTVKHPPRSAPGPMK